MAENHNNYFRQALSAAEEWRKAHVKLVNRAIALGGEISRVDQDCYIVEPPEGMPLDEFMQRLTRE